MAIKRIFILATFLLNIMILKAQNATDALRYSQITFDGTARFNSMGGAFGALGGDFSSLSFNPAGIGIYKSSEFTFSPSIFTGKTSSSYLGTTAEDIKYNFNFNNIGGILTYKNNGSNPDWESVSFGIGYNKTNNFNNRVIIEGKNSSNSILDLYTYYANQNPNNLSPFDEGLAKDVNLIFPDTFNVNGYTHKGYFSDMEKNYIVNNAKYGVLQRKAITSYGSTGEFVLSLGANYKDKFYIGGTLGITTLKYNEQSEYKEMDIANTPYFKALTLNENLNTTGEGFNFKLGFIYRATDWIRIGAAVHTPTFYNMSDTWNKRLKSEFDSVFTNMLKSSPDGNYDYELTTPMRAIGSIAFVIGKKGIISADYEFVDYSEARFRSSTGDDFADENSMIRDIYKPQHNIRIGGELRLDPVSFRAGYAFYGSPYKNGINDGKKNNYSFGIGFRENNYFVDLAYVITTSKEDYYLYNKDIATTLTPSLNTITTQNFLITLGFKF